MGIAYLGALLLALHLISSQVVHAQVETKPDTVASKNGTVTNKPTVKPTSTTSSPSKDNGAGRTDAFTLLLPLAVGASLLLGWS
ncbi:hypothetical protein ABVT39_022236 [Epinephelus coioides]